MLCYIKTVKEKIGNEINSGENDVFIIMAVRGSEKMFEMIALPG